MSRRPTCPSDQAADPLTTVASYGDPFGDVLPTRTSDENPQGWGDADDDRDDELRRDIPPHHG